MAGRDSRPTPRLQQLEARDVPSAVVLRETFEGADVPALPDGWSAAGDGLATSEGRPFAGEVGLVSDGRSDQAGRLWADLDLAADSGVGATVFADSLIPVRLFTRGQGLDTPTPTYYAVEVTRGLGLELIRVADGEEAVLAEANSRSWYSGRWAEVTLFADGDGLRVEVTRPDTGEYLNADGDWQAGPADALSAADGAITGGGRAGVERAARYAGAVFVDDVTLYEGAGDGGPFLEDFDSTPVGDLPAEWGAAADGPGPGFRVLSQAHFSPEQSLATSGPSFAASRAWPAEVQPADAEASVNVLLSSLIPAEVLVRGQGLDGESPSYYAAAVTRGAALQIRKVTDGETEVLADLRSENYFSREWSRVTLRAEGDTLAASLQRLDTGEFLAADGTWQPDEQAALTATDGDLTEPGHVGVSRPARYSGTVFFDDFAIDVDEPQSPPPPPPPGNPDLPDIPRHYDHIRIAQLAYAGTPVGEFELALLEDSVDLVVPNPAFLETFEATAPETPRLIYTNLSNLYSGLLTDWLAFADGNGHDREAAFYHVAEASGFRGDSPSSIPVDWLWGTWAEADDGRLTSRLSQARGTVSGSVDFRNAAHFAYPERFRELNFDLAATAKPAWAGTFEYVTAVNPDGSPAAWAELPLTSDTTAAFTADGTVTFDPPADWVPSRVGGGAALYAVRVRTTAGAADAPTADTVHGRDYVNAGDSIEGVIPAFDAQADANADGHLNDAEFAGRRDGFDARFVYESRLFYPVYGQMRFGTNPAGDGFAAWAADYHVRFLADSPLADGLFVDNSNGRPPLDGEPTVESVEGYAAAYGDVLRAVGGAVAPRWLMANTAGGFFTADEVVPATPATFEEFALRPLAHTWSQFRDIADLVARRQSLADPTPYLVLDSLPQGGDPEDPRTQMATLAYYYLLADPDTTFLMFYGGHEPASEWSRHWAEAVRFDVGQPVAGWGTFADGFDPSDPSLAYRVYGREYDNALVLYKPLSYQLGVGRGGLGDDTATSHDLGGAYRELRADGTLGPVITDVNLRNGEGAVLIQVGL